MRACSDREEQRNDGRLYIQKPGSPPYKVVLPSCKSSRVCPLSPSLSPPCSLLSSFPLIHRCISPSLPIFLDILHPCFFLVLYPVSYISHLWCVLFPRSFFYSFVVSFYVSFNVSFPSYRFIYFPLCYSFCRCSFLLSLCYKFYIIVALLFSVFRQR